MRPSNTCGGAVDQTAIIGHAPESRVWYADSRSYPPELGEAVRIEAFVTVDAGLDRPTRIGCGAWLMKHVHIGHDAQVDNWVEIAPGAVICGHAEIGHSVRIGVNASVLPFVKIGAEARIGAGAVVIKDVPAGEIWAGNPAKRLRRRWWRRAAT